MPMTWDDKADAKLLISILYTSNVSLDYKGMAEFMGPECTVIAVQRRIQRLKEKVQKLQGENGNSNGDSSAPATPIKKRGRPAGSGSAKGRKKTKTQDDGDETPSKVKAEEDQADGEAST